MPALTQIQCHYVKDKINNRIRFGMPKQVVKLDKHRQLAIFLPGQIFGYIRWRANEYGTQDWRIFIVKSQSCGQLTIVPGIMPAVQLLTYAAGFLRVKRALKAIDMLEKQCKCGLEDIPESYWRQFENTLLLKSPLRHLPQNFIKKDVYNVG